jgi:hypothetical protein
MDLRYSPLEALHWLELRLNRPLAPGSFTLRDAHHHWRIEPAASRVLVDPVGTAKPVDFLFVITTYNRAAPCQRLVTELARNARALAPARSHVVVLDDASAQDYAGARGALKEHFPEAHAYLRARRNVGKAGFWKTYQTAFFAAQHLRPRHAIFLQDDLELRERFLENALETWNAIEDPRKRVLNLFTAADDEPGGRWVRFQRVEFDHARYRLTQWFDLAAFLVDSSFFELLGYRIFPVHQNRWKRNPVISSGVGAQLTRRLYGRGNVYQVTEPLLSHGSEPSLMNPEARQVRPFDNRR